MPKTPADIAAHEAGLVSTFIKDYLVGAEIPPLVFFANDRKTHEKAKPTRYRCYLHLLACCKELWPIRRCLDLAIYDMRVRGLSPTIEALYLSKFLNKTYRRVKYMKRINMLWVTDGSGGLAVDGFCYVTETCTLADLVREYKKTSPLCSELVSVEVFYRTPETLLSARLWATDDKGLATVLCKDTMHLNMRLPDTRFEHVTTL